MSKHSNLLLLKDNRIELNGFNNIKSHVILQFYIADGLLCMKPTKTIYYNSKYLFVKNENGYISDASLINIFNHHNIKRLQLTEYYGVYLGCFNSNHMITKSDDLLLSQIIETYSTSKHNVLLYSTMNIHMSFCNDSANRYFETFISEGEYIAFLSPLLAKYSYTTMEIAQLTFCRYERNDICNMLFHITNLLSSSSIPPNVREFYDKICNLIIKSFEKDWLYFIIWNTSP